MTLCRACGLGHSPLVRCEIANAIAKSVAVANDMQPIANVVGEIYPRYRNKEARRMYMRDLMRKRRAMA